MNIDNRMGQYTNTRIVKSTSIDIRLMDKVMMTHIG